MSLIVNKGRCSLCDRRLGPSLFGWTGFDGFPTAYVVCNDCQCADEHTQIECLECGGIVDVRRRLRIVGTREARRVAAALAPHFRCAECRYDAQNAVYSM